jgi:AcrR family transcriptional regulator
MEENATFADLKSEAKLARRELIVEAAERVFAVKPFHKVSIRDIAQEAGISHALIYRYFPDQQSIFVEAFIRGAEEIGGIIEQLIDESETPDIAKISDTFLSLLHRQRPVPENADPLHARRLAFPGKSRENQCGGAQFLRSVRQAVPEDEETGARAAPVACLLRGPERGFDHVPELPRPHARSGETAHVERRPGD